MRNLVKTAFIILTVLFAFTDSANAAILTSQYITDRIKDKVTKQLSSVIKGKISVYVKPLPYNSITVPDGHVTVETTINQNVFSSNTLAKVTLWVNGSEVESFGVPLKITVLDNVWVAKDNINKGEALTDINTSIEEKDISLIADYAARQNSDVLNSITKKNFHSGEIIDNRFVEIAPTVRRNSYVSVIFQTASITIVSDGEALDDGRLGDFVKVRNKKYKTFYTGKVISANTILVNI